MARFLKPEPDWEQSEVILSCGLIKSEAKRTNPQIEFPRLKKKVTAQFEGVALLFGLVVAALGSEVNAGAWSPVYCMARRRNFRIILAAGVLVTRSQRQRISFAGVSGHPLGRTSVISRHSDKTCRTVSSRSPQRRLAVVADQPCRTRSSRRSLCFALARNICTASLLGTPCK
ncbi:hypothetical protein PoB_002763700 [Plakobranchus ocellatus]|uniref:Uncharacterized protein n=1 Tax=Plakobranchus ocellatus TaxID=259542 RepID=A0AAV4A1F4_9GAST|nr:hypothetical protein PoB_002763700 [Plakobranchus ocellatus]